MGAIVSPSLHDTRLRVASSAALAIHIPFDEVDVVRMRPGHLMVNQQHGGVVGCKDGFVHFQLLSFSTFPK
jgi:hypothetical protein